MNSYLMARAAFRFIGILLIIYSIYALISQLIFGPAMLGEPSLDGQPVGELAHNPLVHVALWYFALNFGTGFFLIAASVLLAKIVAGGGAPDDGGAWKP